MVPSKDGETERGRSLSKASLVLLTHGLREENPLSSAYSCPSRALLSW